MLKRRSTVEKIKRRVRKLPYWERYELMDWLNAWYQAEKEQRQEEEEFS